MTERQYLLNDLDNARKKILELLPEAEIHLDKEIYQGWTLKELLAHMTGWDDAVVTSLRAHASGEEPGTPANRGIDAYNAETVSAREKLEYDHTRKEWERTRETLKDIIRKLPADKIVEPLVFPWEETGTVAYLIDIFIRHENDHARDILTWLESLEHPPSIINNQSKEIK